MADEVEFTSRYDAFGPPNGCKGQCEGTGFVPIAVYGIVPPKRDAHPSRISTGPDDATLLEALMWFLQEVRSPNEDGDDWHFVPCPDCKPDDRLVRLAKALHDKFIRRELAQFAGFLSAALPELSQTELPRVAEIVDQFVDGARS